MPSKSPKNISALLDDYENILNEASDCFRSAAQNVYAIEAIQRNLQIEDERRLRGLLKDISPETKKTLGYLFPEA